MVDERLRKTVILYFLKNKNKWSKYGNKFMCTVVSLCVIDNKYTDFYFTMIFVYLKYLIISKELNQKI
jgi:hypothetical protein